MDDNIHTDIVKRLDKFIEMNNVPNILLHGESGCGKKTILKRFINKIYENVEKKDYVMNVNCSHGKGIKFIRDELKFFAKINTNTNMFKSIILINAEKLTIDAQSALRRCIELFSKNTRFFMLVTNKETILKPIISRFSIVHVPLPLIKNVIINMHKYNNKKNDESYIKKRSQYIKKILCGDIKGDIFELSIKLYEKGYSGIELIEYLKKNEKDTIKKYQNMIYYEKIMKEIRNEKIILFQILLNEKK